MGEVLGYLAQKVTSTLGGLIGAISHFPFSKPKTMLEALIRGGLSTTFSFFFSIPLLWYFNLPYTNWQWQLASGFVCGFAGYALLSSLSRFLTLNIFSRFAFFNYLPIERGTHAKLPKKSPAGRKRRAVK